MGYGNGTSLAVWEGGSSGANILAIESNPPFQGGQVRSIKNQKVKGQTSTRNGALPSRSWDTTIDVEEGVVYGRGTWKSKTTEDDKAHMALHKMMKSSTFQSARSSPYTYQGSLHPAISKSDSPPSNPPAHPHCRLISSLTPFKQPFPNPLTHNTLTLLQADAEFTDPVEAAELKRKRTFRKYSYRGIELDKLLDLSNDQFIEVRSSQVPTRITRRYKRKKLNGLSYHPLAHSSSTLVPADVSNEDSSASPSVSSRSSERPRRRLHPTRSQPPSRPT